VPTCSRRTMSGRGWGQSPIRRRDPSAPAGRGSGRRGQRFGVGVDRGRSRPSRHVLREGEAEQRRPRQVVSGSNSPSSYGLMNQPIQIPNSIENDPISPLSDLLTKHVVQCRHCHFPTRCRENNQPHLPGGGHNLAPAVRPVTSVGRAGVSPRICPPVPLGVTPRSTAGSPSPPGHGAARVPFVATSLAPRGGICAGLNTPPALRSPPPCHHQAPDDLDPDDDALSLTGLPFGANRAPRFLATRPGCRVVHPPPGGEVRLSLRSSALDET